MNGRRILVTGAKGMLGTALLEGFDSSDELIGMSDVDITDSALLRKRLVQVKPEIIVHAAALTDVEKCEKEKDKAYKVNVIGTQNIVNYCADEDIALIYISSTGIYGTKSSEAYSEYDGVFPTTIHHMTKYLGEKSVEAHLNKYLIVRTGWLYGGVANHNKNFVHNRCLEARNNNIIYSDDSQIGNPTYVKDVVAQIKLLISEGHYGIFNCVNIANKISRYDYVQEIVRLSGEKCDVKIAKHGSFKRCAPVAFNESASNYKLSLLNINIMRDWEIALSDYMETLL